METQIDLAPSKPIFLPVPQESDFIVDYVKYADIFEAPPEAHEAVALTALGAALNKNVSIKNGGQHLTLDFWTMLLSGSGVGRNTLTSLLWPVLEEAKLTDLVKNSSWGSKQGFYQNLAEHPRGFFVWEEMSVALKALSDARFGEAKQWLTNLYDNLRPPAEIKYRQRGTSGDTPSIVFPVPPRVNILATSSEDWFVSGLAQEDSMGGFIPRWFFVRLPDVGREIPIPRKPDSSLIPPLGDCIREASKLSGEVDLSRVSGMYTDWYHETHKAFRLQPNRGLAEAFWNRHRVHLLKLATIYGVAESGDLSVSATAMEQAIVAARKAQETIFDMLKTGMSREGMAVDRMEELIRSGGTSGMLKSEFTRAFQDTPSHIREARLKTLQEGGTIVSFLRSTGGRPGVILVHAEFDRKHREAHPNDKPL
jgi:hypothetical protein